jgi:sugar transport system substrate-binding protein
LVESRASGEPSDGIMAARSRSRTDGRRTLPPPGPPTYCAAQTLPPTLRASWPSALGGRPDKQGDNGRDNVMKSWIIAALAVALGASAAAAADPPILGAIVFQQDQYFRSLQLGMEDASKSAGVQLLQGNSESKAEKEATLIDTFVTRGAKAILISPISAKASQRALQRAADKGVKIVLYNTRVEADLQVAYIGTSNTDIGVGTGTVANDFIKTKLGGRANVAILEFRSLLPEQSDGRSNGFLSAATPGNDFKIVARQDAWLAEKAVSVASDLLTAHPEINVIYAANEGGTVGAVQAVRRAGKQGKVFVFGTDGSEQLANFLLDPDGVLIATTAQQPFVIGTDGVKVAMAAIDGKPVEKEIMVPALPLSRTNEAGVHEFLDGLKKLQ